MKLGICIGPDTLADAAAAGFDFAETGVWALAPDKGEADFAPLRAAMLSAPIRMEAVNCFLPGELNVTGADVDLDPVRRHMELVLRRAAEVGVKIMVFGSGGARKLPEGFPVERGWDQLAAAARLAADIAARHGITIAMEPLCKRACNFFNRVDQGAAFVDRVGHAHLQLLADLFHMADGQEPFVNITAAGKRLVHIHLATPSIPQTAPGTDYDFTGFFDALRQAGYDGRVSVEDNPDLLGKSKLPRIETLRAVREYLAPLCRG